MPYNRVQQFAFPDAHGVDPTALTYELIHRETNNDREQVNERVDFEINEREMCGEALACRSAQ